MIKKNVESGAIRTTDHFQRDMMLMFTNALMYNNSDQNIYKMATEMYNDIMANIEVSSAFYTCHRQGHSSQTPCFVQIFQEANAGLRTVWVFVRSTALVQQLRREVTLQFSAVLTDGACVNFVAIRASAADGVGGEQDAAHVAPLRHRRHQRQGTAVRTD